MQCSQQLRRTADEKFNRGWELSFVYSLWRKTVHVLAASAAVLERHGNNFPTLQVLAGFFLGMSAGSMAVESLLILCYWTNMQQPAIKLITSNTAQVNFPAWQPGLYHRAVFNFRVISCLARTNVTSAVRLLDVDYFVKCDFESLRLTGLSRLANSNKWHKTVRFVLLLLSFIQWPHICCSTIIVHRPTLSYQQKSVKLQKVLGQHNINSYNIIRYWDMSITIIIGIGNTLKSIK